MCLHFSASIRGPAASIVTGSNWAFACIVTKSYVHIKEAIGNSFTFWGYGAICLLCVVFVFFCVPETLGRTLEDIETNSTAKSVEKPTTAPVKAEVAPAVEA